MRTNIVDTGLGMSVFQLFMKEGEDRRVMHAASTVICNIVTDFSPLRSVRVDRFRLASCLETNDISPDDD